MHSVFYIRRPLTDRDLSQLGELGQDAMRTVFIDSIIRPKNFGFDINDATSRAYNENIVASILRGNGWIINWLGFGNAGGGLLNMNISAQVKNEFSVSQINSNLKSQLSEFMTFTWGPNSYNSTVSTTTTAAPPTPAPGTAAGISTFTFDWSPAAGAGGGMTDLGEAHRRFNNLLVANFPKLLYAAPYSSYTNATTGVRSRLFAIGETRLSSSATRQKIVDLAQQAGFTGNTGGIAFKQVDNAALASGADTLAPPSDTVDRRVTSDGSPFNLSNIFGTGLTDLAANIGISVGMLTVIAGGVVIYAVTKD